MYSLKTLNPKPSSLNPDFLRGAVLALERQVAAHGDRQVLVQQILLSKPKSSLGIIRVPFLG